MTTLQAGPPISAIINFFLDAPLGEAEQALAVAQAIVERKRAAPPARLTITRNRISGNTAAPAASAASAAASKPAPPPRQRRRRSDAGKRRAEVSQAAPAVPELPDQGDPEEAGA